MPTLPADGAAPKNTGALRELIGKFSPATMVDHDLILAAALTMVTGIEPGRRPAFLIQAEDEDKHGGRGAGKTTCARMLAYPFGGHIEIQANDEWSKVVTRLLSPAALGKRVAILDNVKSHRFSWAELEAAITADVISGRALYVGEGRRPNTLTYFITLNGANLSKDMAQRCVPIMLKRPAYDPRWEEETIDLINRRRWEILGDMIHILASPAPALRRFSRWSAWEQAVLSRVGDPSECQRVIEERQAAIDDDKTEQDMVRDGFRSELTRRGHHPDSEKIFMPSRDAAEIFNKIQNEERRHYGRAMVALYMLKVPEIRKSNRGEDGRGCVWIGEEAAPGANAVPLNPPVGYTWTKPHAETERAF